MIYRLCFLSCSWIRQFRFQLTVTLVELPRIHALGRLESDALEVSISFLQLVILSGLAGLTPGILQEA